MMYSKETKEVVLLPEAVHINDGETGLTVKHEESHERQQQNKEQMFY